MRGTPDNSGWFVAAPQAANPRPSSIATVLIARCYYSPSMRAIAITKPGGPETLVLVERPLPEPSRGEVRVRVRATAVNRADLLQRMGAYPAPFDSPRDIPGLEFAGKAAAWIDGVSPTTARFKSREFAIRSGGVSSAGCFPLPAGCSLAAGAVKGRAGALNA